MRKGHSSSGLSTGLLLSLSAIPIGERSLFYCERCGEEVDEDVSICLACAQAEARMRRDAALEREVAPVVQRDRFAARPEEMRSYSRTQIWMGVGAILAMVGVFRPWIALVNFSGIEGYYMPCGQLIIVLAIAALVATCFLEHGWHTLGLLIALSIIGMMIMGLVAYQYLEWIRMLVPPYYYEYNSRVGDGTLLCSIGGLLMLVAGLRRLRRARIPLRTAPKSF